MLFTFLPAVVLYLAGRCGNVICYLLW